MTTVYTLVSWLAILGYWLLIAGVTLRILMKRRAVPSAIACLSCQQGLLAGAFYEFLKLNSFHLISSLEVGL